MAGGRSRGASEHGAEAAGGPGSLWPQLLAAKRRRDWATAEALLRQALADRPGDAYLRASYADLLVRRGDPEEGLALADEVLRERPGFAPALLARGLGAERLRRGREALAAFEAAWVAAPSPYAARCLARARAAAGASAEAIALVRQALERFPRDPALLRQEALLLEGAGEEGDAAAVYREAVAAGSGDGFAYARMLRATLAGRAPEEALAALEPVLRLPGRASDPHLLGLRAELQQAAGRWQEAVASWEGALAADPGNGYVRARLAYACRHAGLRARAWELLQAVIEADPADPAALAAFVADAAALDRREEAAAFLAELLRRHPGRRALWGWMRRLQRDAEPPAGEGASPAAEGGSGATPRRRGRARRR